MPTLFPCALAGAAICLRSLNDEDKMNVLFRSHSDMTRNKYDAGQFVRSSTLRDGRAGRAGPARWGKGYSGLSGG